MKFDTDGIKRELVSVLLHRQKGSVSGLMNTLQHQKVSDSSSSSLLESFHLYNCVSSSVWLLCSRSTSYCFAVINNGVVTADTRLIYVTL